MSRHSVITIKEIAEKAGVSVVTVSRAINNSGFVKEETRKRINEVMTDCNYIPLKAQKKWANGSSAPTMKHHSFTMVWNDTLSAADMTAQALIQGASQAASRLGLSLMLETAQPTGNPVARKTDGFLLCGKGFHESFMTEIRNYPVVWLLQSGLHDFGDRVQPDHTQIGHLSYRALRDKGCRNLCCISCRKKAVYPSYWQTREFAFCNAAEADGVRCHCIHMDYNDNLRNPMALQAEAAQTVVRQILAMPERPDGIFVVNTLGSPVYSELVKNNLIPGRDLELVAGDKEVCSGYFNPPPILIDIQATSIGEMAVRMMMWRLANPDAPRMTHLVSPSLEIPKK